MFLFAISRVCISSADRAALDDSTRVLWIFVIGGRHRREIDLRSATFLTARKLQEVGGSILDALYRCGGEFSDHDDDDDDCNRLAVSESRALYILI